MGVLFSAFLLRVFTEKEGVQNVLMRNFARSGTEKHKGRSTSETYGVRQYDNYLYLIDYFFLMYIQCSASTPYGALDQRAGGRNTNRNDGQYYSL